VAIATIFAGETASLSEESLCFQVNKPRSLLRLNGQLMPDFLKPHNAGVAEARFNVDKQAR
jgi:hypothetical protein